MSRVKNVAAVVGLMALGAFVWDQVAESRAQEKEKAAPAVQKWEYKIVRGINVEKFNQAGDDGWECVGTHGDNIETIFKRPKK
jgi:hypothetical protein